MRRGVFRSSRASDHNFVTSAACGPFCPWSISNSTRSPSASDLNPLPWMALKWTKTSGPPSRDKNPYPFASLNHFTVPVIRAIERTSYGEAVIVEPASRTAVLRQADAIALASQASPTWGETACDASEASFVQLV